MAFPLGSLVSAIVPRRPALAIRDNAKFSRIWPKMKASVNFLLRWQGIKVDSNVEWLKSYLNVFSTYIEPSTVLDNWDELDFSMPNFDKSSKERNALVFPPNFHLEDSREIAEIIMVFNKS